MEKSLTSYLWIHYQHLLENKDFEWKLISVTNDNDACEAVFEARLPDNSRTVRKTAVESARGWKSHICVV